MGVHLIVKVVYGAIYTKKELAPWEDLWDRVGDLQVQKGYTDPGNLTPYLSVVGSAQRIASTGGGFCDERGVAPLDSFKIEGPNFRSLFQEFCEAYGIPFQEPGWLLVWGFH
jgi:hypothetical protein